MGMFVLSAPLPGILMEKSKYILTAMRKPIISFRIAIAYCNLEFLAIEPDTPRASYIFNIGK